MIDVKNLQIELKIGAFLGLIALVLSLLTGIIAGISPGIVFLRAFFGMLIFAGIGYGAVTVLKKFVPEIGSLSTDTSGEAGDLEAGIDDSPDEERISVLSGDEGLETPADSFTELNTDEIPRVQPEGDGFEPQSPLSGPEGSQSAATPSSGKLGKHIIADEELFKYEPKLMAEAVRTMMSKDEE